MIVMMLPFDVLLLVSVVDRIEQLLIVLLTVDGDVIVARVAFP